MRTTLLVSTLLAVWVESGETTCVPRHITPADDQIILSSRDRLYQDGDINFLNCSTPSGPAQRPFIGWCPRADDAAPKIQIDLPEPMAIHGFHFQMTVNPCADSHHRYDMEAFMATFDLQYVYPGDPERILITYERDISALYGTAADSVVHLEFPVVASTFTIVPKLYSRWPCFRFAILACDTANMCPDDWCLNGGKCVGKSICTCAHGFYGERCNKTADSIVQEDFSFMEIKDNVLTTPAGDFDVIGDVTLVTSRRRRHGHGHGGGHYGHGHGHSCHIRSSGGHHSYAQYGHHHHGHGGHGGHGHSHCMSNLGHKHPGFTTSMNVNLHHHHPHTTIFSNWGQQPGHNGVSLSHHGNHLHAHVNTPNHHWNVSALVNMVANVWHQVTTSWNPHIGINLFVNNQHVGSSGPAVPTSSPGNQVVPLRIGNGYNGLSVNVNISVANLVMYPLSRQQLTIAGINAFTAPPPTTPTTPTTPSKPTATSTHHRTTTTTPIPTTTGPYRPMCFACTSAASIQSCTHKTRCNVGEVCTLFKDKTGYTSKCLTKQLCQAGKRLASGQCWECCSTYLCNDHCSASTTATCADKPSCATMMATGYDVCKSQTMAVNMCRKTCKIC